MSPSVSIDEDDEYDDSVIHILPSWIIWSFHVSKRQLFSYFLAELLGTAVFVYIGCAGCMVGKHGQVQDTEQISIIFGLAYMISIMLFSHISLGVFNPIVTVSALMMSKISVVEFLPYILGQFLGAMFGYSLIFFIAPMEQLDQLSVGLCAPHIEGHLSIIQALAIEFLISLVFCSFYCVAWKQYANWYDSLSLTLGIAYMAITMATIGYTGAHMNPFRSFAPAVFNNDWDDHWVYWVGPFTASLLAPLIYKLVQRYDKKTKVPYIK